MPPTPEHARDLYLRRTYNITLDDYRHIVAAQHGRCPICSKPLEGISNPVDHDHVTRLVRGVLHTYCNHRVLGRLRDWATAQNMADYLRTTPAGKAIGHRQVPPKKPKKRRTTSGKSRAKVNP